MKNKYKKIIIFVTVMYLGAILVNTLLTLKYFYETLGNPVIEGTGVGIIPYVYEEAKNNYIRQKDINEANQERQYNGTKKYIKINPIKNHNEKPIIDFNALEVDDE